MGDAGKVPEIVPKASCGDDGYRSLSQGVKDGAQDNGHGTSRTAAVAGVKGIGPVILWLSFLYPHPDGRPVGAGILQCIIEYFLNIFRGDIPSPQAADKFEDLGLAAGAVEGGL